MQPYQVVFMAVVASVVLSVSALAKGSWGLAVCFAVLAVVCWGAYLGMATA